MDNWSIGVDIVDINRFRSQSLSDHERFYKQVFNEYELQYCKQFSDPYPHLAGIFAAKEAAFKAINNFFQLKLSDISIYHDEQGKPFIKLKKNVVTRSVMDTLEDDGGITIQASITHTTDIALAWAIMLRKLAEYTNIELWDDILIKTQQVVYNELKH